MSLLARQDLHKNWIMGSRHPINIHNWWCKWSRNTWFYVKSFAPCEPRVKTQILNTHLYSRPVVVPMVPYIDLFYKSTFVISSNVIPNAPEGSNFGNNAVWSECSLPLSLNIVVVMLVQQPKVFWCIFIVCDQYCVCMK